MSDEPRRATARRHVQELTELASRLPVTTAIAIATVAVFGLEYALGGTTDQAAQMRLGALRPDRVTEEGELYRLVMPMLLHHGIVHIGMNAVAYLQLMMLTEYLYGPARALIFYVLCGVSATIATTLLAPPWIGGSVGASGAIMGLAGLLLGASWYGAEPWRSRLRQLFGRRLLGGVLLTFAIGIGLSFVLPIVDNWGHAGGFAGGLVLAALYRDPERENRTFVPALAGALAAVWVGCIGWTAVDGGEIVERLDEDNAELLARRASLETDGIRTAMYLAEMVRAHHRAGLARAGRVRLRDRLVLAIDPATPQIVAAQLLDQPAFDREVGIALERWADLAPDDPTALNALAWHLVTRHDLERREPLRAEALALRSLSLLSADDREQRAAILDTHAEALYQLGRFDEALVEQREAVALAEQSGMAELPEMRDRLERIEAALGAG